MLKFDSLTIYMYLQVEKDLKWSFVRKHIGNKAACFSTYLQSWWSIISVWTGSFYF